jgi:RNA polymerase sigma-70 factor (family 1)
LKALSDIVINNFKKGDRKAFKLIFTVLYPSICFFADKYLHDHDEAEDITQEVFIALWDQRGNFNSIDHIKTFLYIAVRNKCLNVLKHRRIKEQYAREQPADATHTTAFEDHLIRSEVIHNIRRAIDSLPECQRKITLLGMQGLKNHEIAEDMNISVNTVKLQKKIAYRKLRKLLESAVVLIFM